MSTLKEMKQGIKKTQRLLHKTSKDGKKELTKANRKILAGKVQGMVKTTGFNAKQMMLVLIPTYKVK